ncbi:MAG: hypothetical protein VX278_03665, partial [Myxococcota bacterium]|nr:hypothetical protein [Myxococcota bacterium]
RKKDSPVFNAGDALLLLDQGGGSLEVSYFLPGEKKRWNVHSFDDLGSVALRDRFFSLGSVKKKKLHNDIERKQERLIQYISKRLELWDGYPVLHGRKVHVYAMGSLASLMLRGNSYDIHNRQITKKFMLGKIKYNKRMLRKHYHSVSELYKVMQDEQMGRSNQMKSVSQRLLLTSGLPAYVGVLKRFQADAMQMCGYGLRYGVFIRLYEQDAQDLGMPPIHNHSG